MRVINALNLTERFNEFRELFETQPSVINFGDWRIHHDRFFGRVHKLWFTLMMSSPFPGGGVVRRPRVMSARYHASLRHLSRAAFVTLDLVECASLAVAGVDDLTLGQYHRL